MIPFLNKFTAFTELIGKLPEEEGIRHVALPLRSVV
jgi:hypothetical protein